MNTLCCRIFLSFSLLSYQVYIIAQIDGGICDYVAAYPLWTSYCPDATIICGFEQFNPIQTCTPPLSVEDDVCEPEGNLCNGASTADNMSWFAFIARSNIIEVSILQILCEEGSDLQAAIWDDCLCNHGNCLVGQSNPCVDNINLLLTDAEIGKTYYLFLDGCDGAQCHVEMTLDNGLDTNLECPNKPTVNGCYYYTSNNSRNTFCFGQDSTTRFVFDMPQYSNLSENNNFEFSWSMTSSNGYLPDEFTPGEILNTQNAFLPVNIPKDQPGIYSICFEGVQNTCLNSNHCILPSCSSFSIFDTMECLAVSENITWRFKEGDTHICSEGNFDIELFSPSNPNTTIHDLKLPAPENQTCTILDSIYLSAQRIQENIENDLFCFQFESGFYKSDYLGNKIFIYPENFIIEKPDTICKSKVRVIALDSTICAEKEIICSEPGSYNVEFDFLDQNSESYLDIDFSNWPSSCQYDSTKLKFTQECIGCPEPYCNLDSIFPGWTSYCPDAIPFCDLFYFDTLNICLPSSHLEDGICEPNAINCGGEVSATNTLWFAFIPTATRLEISIDQKDCQFGDGIEASIWDGCVCDGGNCLIGDSYPCSNIINLFFTKAQIGTTYYICVTGCEASICNIDISIRYLEPEPLPCPLAPDINVCNLTNNNFSDTICPKQNGDFELHIINTEFLKYNNQIESGFKYYVESDNGFIPDLFTNENPKYFDEAQFSIRVPGSLTGNYTICFEGIEIECDNYSCEIPKCNTITISNSNDCNHIIETVAWKFNGGNQYVCSGSDIKIELFDPEDPDNIISNAIIQSPENLSCKMIDSLFISSERIIQNQVEPILSCVEIESKNYGSDYYGNKIFIYPKDLIIIDEGNDCFLQFSVQSLNNETCLTQSKSCNIDSIDLLHFDFTDDSDGFKLDLDFENLPDNCLLDSSKFIFSDSCFNCDVPICGYFGAYPYWTSYCPDATIICDFEQFNPIFTCTPPLSVEDDVCEPEGNLCNGSSTADNMSWFAFVAGSTTIDINFLQIDCESGDLFQAGIWDECICNGGSCLVGSSSPCAKNIDLLLTNATIGETYYIFLDGCMGSQCNINITISQAPNFIWECPLIPQIDMCEVNDYDSNFTENTYCFVENDTLNLFFDMPQYEELIGSQNATFTWSFQSDNGFLPTIFNNQDIITLDEPFINLAIPPNQVGKYNLCFEKAENDCDNTNDCNVPKCFNFQTVELADQDWGEVDVCYSVLASYGYFPLNPPDPTWYWQGPPIVTFDLNADGSYTFQAVNQCGCIFNQSIKINIIDFIQQTPYTVYLCEDDPCPSFSTQYGPITYCAGEANDELLFLPGLAPTGCDLPVFLSVVGIDDFAILDTVSSSCKHLELQLNYETSNEVNTSYFWHNENGALISIDPSYKFTKEGKYDLVAIFHITNELGESKQCSKTYNFDINLDNLPLSQPKLWPFETVHCPGNPKNIIFRIQNEGYFNQWQTDPPNLISASGTNNVVGNLSWDGSQDVEVCVHAFTPCDDGVQFSKYVCFTITADQCACYEDQLSLSGDISQSNYQAIESIIIQNGVINQDTITFKAGACIEVESIDINAGAEVLLEIKQCPE